MDECVFSRIKGKLCGLDYSTTAPADLFMQRTRWWWPKMMIRRYTCCSRAVPGMNRSRRWHVVLLRDLRFYLNFMFCQYIRIQPKNWRVLYVTKVFLCHRNPAHYLLFRVLITHRWIKERTDRMNKWITALHKLLNGTQRNLTEGRDHFTTNFTERQCDIKIDSIWSKQAEMLKPDFRLQYFRLITLTNEWDGDHLILKDRKCTLFFSCTSCRVMWFAFYGGNTNAIY